MIITLEQFKQIFKESIGKTDILTREHIELVWNLAARTIRADEKAGLIKRMNKNPVLAEYKVEDTYLYLAKKKKFSVPPDLNLPDFNADRLFNSQRITAH